MTIKELKNLLAGKDDLAMVEVEIVNNSSRERFFVDEGTEVRSLLSERTILLTVNTNSID